MLPIAEPTLVFFNNSLSCPIAFPNLLVVFFEKLIPFLAVVPIFCAFFTAIIPTAIPPTNEVELLSSWNPNIFLTIFSPSLINFKHNIAKTPFTSWLYSEVLRIPGSPLSITFASVEVSTINPKAVLTKAIYNIQWNGCINIVYINSFNHVPRAWAFPSPILSIEYYCTKY